MSEAEDKNCEVFFSKINKIFYLLIRPIKQTINSRKAGNYNHTSSIGRFILDFYFWAGFFCYSTAPFASTDYSGFRPQTRHPEISPFQLKVI